MHVLKHSHRQLAPSDPRPPPPDFDRAQRLGEFWGHRAMRTFGELLIDLEEDKVAQAVVFGLLREMES